MIPFLTPIALFFILFRICSSSVLSSDKDGFEGTKSESDLRRHLFHNYDKLVRPVKHADHKTTALFGITPLHLRELDEKNQLLVLDAWMTLKWNDEYLTWEPSQYGNLSVLRVPSTEVWRPDLAIFLAPTESNLFPVPRTNALIYSNGDVLWVPLFQIKSRCPVTRTKNDVTCSIRVGSWTYPAIELDLQLYSEQADLTKFSDNNPNWKLMNFTTDGVKKYPRCCFKTYLCCIPYISHNMTLKRREDNLFENNEVLQEDTPIKLQNVDLSDFVKLLSR